jgi:uncharacterized protein YqeY
MRKMAYLQMLLKRLEEKSREYRQIQSKAPNYFDISEEEKERREAEDKARKAARAAYRDAEMYLFGIIDIYNPTPVEAGEVMDKMNIVYRELTAIYHQDGGRIDKAVKAVCDCIRSTTHA